MPTLFKPSPRNLWAALVVREPTLERAIAELVWRVVPWAMYGSFLVGRVIMILVPGADFAVVTRTPWPAADSEACRVPSASLVRTPFKVAAATGLACQGVAAATGLGAVIVRVQALFKAIKSAGIAYSRLIQALTSWQPAMAI
jgi:hypothetical protein